MPDDGVCDRSEAIIAAAATEKREWRGKHASVSQWNEISNSVFICALENFNCVAALAM